MKEFWTWALNNLGITIPGAIILLSTFIEITPIKMNPLRTFWSLLRAGRVIEKLDSQLDAVKEELDKVKSGVDDANIEIEKIKSDRLEDKALTCRRHILNIHDQIIRGDKIHRDSLKSALIDSSFYEKYCTEHPDFSNNLTKAAISIITKKYDELVTQGSEYT